MGKTATFSDKDGELVRKIQAYQKEKNCRVLLKWFVSFVMMLCS